jgi:hypothetical protein
MQNDNKTKTHINNFIIINQYNNCYNKQNQHNLNKQNQHNLNKQNQHNLNKQNQHNLNKQNQHNLNKQNQHNLNKQNQHNLNKQNQHNLNKQNQHNLNKQNQHNLNKQNQLNNTNIIKTPNYKFRKHNYNFELIKINTNSYVIYKINYYKINNELKIPIQLYTKYNDRFIYNKIMNIINLSDTMNDICIQWDILVYIINNNCNISEKSTLTDNINKIHKILS